ncbi:MAG TPA: hypothetical protein VJ997_11110, partial [Longimicrobiales bacterium]|nr:hypothetical protein [Longimicrobiales bacterium]
MPFTAWVRGLLDGLGLPVVGVVADGGFGILALGFTLADPERVDRLVLAFRDVADPRVRGAAFEDALTVTGRPVLVVRVGATAQGGDGPGFGGEV